MENTMKNLKTKSEVLAVLVTVGLVASVLFSLYNAFST